MFYRQRVLRGVQIEASANKVQAYLDRLNHKHELERITPADKQELHQPQLSIANFRLPRFLEDLGIFCVGSPGSGKTQAISQLISELKQRPDFRIVCFDRNGEFTNSFFKSDKDILFNPTDKRSIGWNHFNESASCETIAASIIPLEGHQDPFWTVSARNLLSEIYRRTRKNEEVWWVNERMDFEQFKSMLSDSMFSKYFNSEKTVSSIIATTTAYTWFYEGLPDLEDNLDFSRWAESGDERSLFLPLFESQAELYKPLYSMVFELIIRGLLSNVDRDIKTAVVIDELGALQKLDSLSRLLAEGRKFKATPIIATQTTAQIDKVYGRDERQIILQGTATKLILNCRDPDSAKTMAEIIGYQEVLEEYGSGDSNSSGNSATSERGIVSSIRTRHAVMPTQIQNLPALSGYLIVGSDTPIVEARITPTDYPVIAPRLSKSTRLNRSESSDGNLLEERKVEQRLDTRIRSKHRESLALDAISTPLNVLRIYDQLGIVFEAAFSKFDDGESAESCEELSSSRYERQITSESAYLVWKVQYDSAIALVQVASIHQVLRSTVTTYPVVLDRISHLFCYSQVVEKLGSLTFVESQS